MFRIYFAIVGNFEAAIIGILWAVLFDWNDGIIARKLEGRSKVHGVYAGVCWSQVDGKAKDGTGYVIFLDENDKVVSNPGGQAPKYVNGELQNQV